MSIALNKLRIALTPILRQILLFMFLISCSIFGVVKYSSAQVWTDFVSLSQSRLNFYSPALRSDKVGDLEAEFYFEVPFLEHLRLSGSSDIDFFSNLLETPYSMIQQPQRIAEAVLKKTRLADIDFRYRMFGFILAAEIYRAGYEIELARSVLIDELANGYCDLSQKQSYECRVTTFRFLLRLEAEKLNSGLHLSSIAALNDIIAEFQALSDFRNHANGAESVRELLIDAFSYLYFLHISQFEDWEFSKFTPINELFVDVLSSRYAWRVDHLQAVAMLASAYANDQMIDEEARTRKYLSELISSIDVPITHELVALINLQTKYQEMFLNGININNFEQFVLAAELARQSHSRFRENGKFLEILSMIPLLSGVGFRNTTAELFCQGERNVHDCGTRLSVLFKRLVSEPNKIPGFEAAGFLRFFLGYALASDVNSSEFALTIMLEAVASAITQIHFVREKNWPIYEHMELDFFHRAKLTSKHLSDSLSGERKTAFVYEKFVEYGRDLSEFLERYVATEDPDENYLFARNKRDRLDAQYYDLQRRIRSCNGCGPLEMLATMLQLRLVMERISEDPNNSEWVRQNYGILLSDAGQSLSRNGQYLEALQLMHSSQMFILPDAQTGETHWFLSRIREASAHAQIGAAHRAVEIYDELYAHLKAASTEVYSALDEYALLTYRANAKQAIDGYEIADDLNRLKELERLIEPGLLVNGPDPEPIQRTEEILDKLRKSSEMEQDAVQREFDDLANYLLNRFGIADNFTYDLLSLHILSRFKREFGDNSLDDKVLGRFINRDLEITERVFGLRQLANFSGRATFEQPSRPHTQEAKERLAIDWRILQEANDTWLNLTFQSSSLNADDGRDRINDMLKQRHRYQRVIDEYWELLSAPFGQVSDQRIGMAIDDLTDQTSQQEILEITEKLTDLSYNLREQAGLPLKPKPTWGYEYSFTEGAVTLSELTGYIFPSEIASSQSPTALLHDNEALISIRHLEEAGFLIVFSVTKDAIAKILIDLDREEITQNIARARDAISKAQGTDFRALSRLYSLIFDDPRIQSTIANKTSWTIIPHGILNSVPFNVLLMESPVKGNEHLMEEMKWLGLHKEISIIPSVAAIKKYRSNTLENLFSKTVNTIVSFSDPNFRNRLSVLNDEIEKKCHDFRGASSGAESSSNIAFWSRQTPLPCTRVEMERIHRLLSEKGWNTIGISGNSATENSLQGLSQSRKLKSARILHFATHAYFSESSTPFGLPGLVLTRPSKRNEPLELEAPEGPALLSKILNDSWIDDGYLSTDDIIKLQLDTDLVILSACDTFNKLGNRASAYSSLVGAFLFSGAKSLIVSHWPVNDAATAGLIPMLLDGNLSDGSNWPRALQNAMRKFVETTSGSDDPGIRKFSHPYYWGGFQAIGMNP